MADSKHSLGHEIIESFLIKDRFNSRKQVKLSCKESRLQKLFPLLIEVPKLQVVNDTDMVNVLVILRRESMSLVVCFSCLHNGLSSL